MNARRTGLESSYQHAFQLELCNANVVRQASELASTLGWIEDPIILDQRTVEFDPLSAPAKSEAVFASRESRPGAQSRGKEAASAALR